MIQTTLIVFGMVHFLDALFQKWFIWDLIQKKGSKSNYQFIFNLSSCRFCLMFHLSWILTLIVCCFSNMNWSFLLVPFVVSGLSHKLK